MAKAQSKSTELTEVTADMIPIHVAKLARRVAQLDKSKAYRLTLWFEGDKPKWIVEAIGTVENQK